MRRCTDLNTCYPSLHCLIGSSYEHFLKIFAVHGGYCAREIRPPLRTVADDDDLAELSDIWLKADIDRPAISNGDLL